MEETAGVSTTILKLLKSNPRGLTVTDISKKIGLNRNSTAKHLGIFTAEGKVEVREIGTAKVYSLTQRVPLSAFLCFTKNMILILDSDGNVVQVNDQFLKLAGCSKQELLGKNLTSVALPVVSTPEALKVIGMPEKEQVTTDIRYKCGDDDFFYQMDVIPTTFEGGEKGLTLVLEDITERKRYVGNMEFLTQTAMELVNLPGEIDIFQYIAERVAELVPGIPRCYVESYDEVNRQFFCRAMVGPEIRKGISEIAGQDVVGMKFPIREYFFAAPFFETPSTFRDMRELHFRPFFDDEQLSFYDVCIHQIPREKTEEMVRRFRIGKLFLTGLVWQDQLFGMVGICLGPEEMLDNKQAIESFVRQASIAIARRQTEDRLHRSEQRFKDIVDLFPTPAAIVDPDGRYLHVNRGFTDLLGYTLPDIPNGKTWFIRAFPDPDLRKEAIAAWKEDLGRIRAGEATSRTFEVQCKSGERIPIGFSPVVLSDGTQFIRFEDCSIVR